MTKESTSFPFVKSFSEFIPSRKGSFAKELYIDQNETTIIKAYEQEHLREIALAAELLTNLDINQHIPPTNFVLSEERIFLVMPFIKGLDIQTTTHLNPEQKESLAHLLQASIVFAEKNKYAPDILDITIVEDFSEKIILEHIVFDEEKAWLIDTWPFKSLSWGNTLDRFKRDVSIGVGELENRVGTIKFAL